MVYASIVEFNRMNHMTPVLELIQFIPLYYIIQPYNYSNVLKSLFILVTNS